MTSLGRHTRPACTQDFTRSLKLCQECGFNSCVRVFFILWGHVSNHAQIWAFVTSISHMGQMRDSDWSRQILLRSDWLQPSVAPITTSKNQVFHWCILRLSLGHISNCYLINRGLHIGAFLGDSSSSNLWFYRRIPLRRFSFFLFFSVLSFIKSHNGSWFYF